MGVSRIEVVFTDSFAVDEEFVIPGSAHVGTCRGDFTRQIEFFSE